MVIAAGCLLHCVGMSIHRDDHERYSLFLTADKLGSLLADAYEEPERSIIVAETLHAIIGHRRDGAPFTVEAGIVRVADALDMARGRSRVPFEAGHQNIHSLSAYAIEDVKITAGARPRRARRDRDVQQRRHLPGRRAARDEAPRLWARGAHRGDRPDRRRARAATDPGLQDLSPVRSAVTPTRVARGLRLRYRMLRHRGDTVQCPVCGHTFSVLPRRLEPAERDLLALRCA